MRPLILRLILLLAIARLTHSQGFPNPSKKTWWAKRMASNDFYTCGRPTERQIKYASESGFKTLISLHTYDADIGDVFTEKGISLPSTENTRYIAEQMADMKFEVVLPSGVRDWMSLDVIRKVHDILRRSVKPVLFYCGSSYGATFLTLAHFLNVTKHNDTLAGERYLTESELFSIGAQLGFDFASDETLRRLVSEITGNMELSVPARADVIIDNWQMKYWQMKPVYKHIFVAGQIQSNELEAIKSAGIKTIINNRKGTTIPPEHVKSQEEVALLNVKDRTGTYRGTGRQSTQQLEANRIDPHKPATYISNTAILNYEMNNALEFGDDIGYNETMERMTIEDILSDVDYIHLPVGGRYKYDKLMWETYKDIILIAARKGPVLMHCNSGFRSGAVAVLAEAYVYCLNSTWAVERARGTGYNLESNQLVIRVLEDVLDKRTNCTIEEGFTSDDLVSSKSTMIWPGVFINVFSLLFVLKVLK